MKRPGDRGPTKIPQCRICLAAGGHLVRTSRWCEPDGRLRILVVARRGRMVLKVHAWVTCTRVSLAGVCGWGWWTCNAAVIARARRHPNLQLLRRYQKAAAQTLAASLH